MSHVGHAYCSALTSSNTRELYTLFGTAVTSYFLSVSALLFLSHQSLTHMTKEEHSSPIIK